MKINNYTVRYRLIEQKILNLYEDFSINNFPITVNKIINIINALPNCKVMSYKDFMKLNNCTMEEVVLTCDSNLGSTHYDKVHNRYLILYNSSTDHHNVTGRILWTLSHELGHVVAGHLPLISNSTLQIAEKGFNNLTNPTLESEADYFAANLLAPFQLFKTLNINSASDIQETFGLSSQASNYRWENYQKWENNHIKTTFDSKIIKYYDCNVK